MLSAASLYGYLGNLLKQRSLLPLIFLAATVNTLAGYSAFEATLLDLRQLASARAVGYANAISNTVRRSAVVPQLLAQDRDVRELLTDPAGPMTAQSLNRRLESVAGQMGAEVVYVMDHGGLTVASSNWNTPDSFIARNFRFRPYFADVLNGAPGQYIAVGTTSLRLGYYLSYPVMSEGKFLGAVVAKLGADLLERDWTGAPDIMLMADEAGVVLLTNRPSWRFRTLHKLSQTERNGIETAQRYPEQKLLPLEVDLTEDDAVVRSGPDAGNYLLAKLKVPESKSIIYVLATAEPIWARSVNILVLTVASVTLLSAGYIFLRRRRVAIQQSIIDEQRAREVLEQRVSERTAELNSANRRLMEVQGELIQSAKLATLGQMSASLAHELSQPIVAMRGFAENGLILLERQRYADLQANLGEVIAVAARMAGITRHLRAFSRRAPPELGRVQLSKVVSECLSLMGARIREMGVRVTIDVADTLAVVAEQLRLEQVVLNLLQNACDALSAVEDRQIIITASRRQQWTLLSVRDCGPGIHPEILPRMFEGFMTTKAADEGLGLGLAISRDIVEEFGGSIEAGNSSEGGAIFVIKLESEEQP